MLGEGKEFYRGLGALPLWICPCWTCLAWDGDRSNRSQQCCYSHTFRKIPRNYQRAFLSDRSIRSSVSAMPLFTPKAVIWIKGRRAHEFSGSQSIRSFQPPPVNAFIIYRWQIKHSGWGWQSFSQHTPLFPVTFGAWECALTPHTPATVSKALPPRWKAGSCLQHIMTATARQWLIKYSPATCLLLHVTPEVTNYPKEAQGSSVDWDGFTSQHLLICHHASVAISAVTPT